MKTLYSAVEATENQNAANPTNYRHISENDESVVYAKNMPKYFTILNEDSNLCNKHYDHFHMHMEVSKTHQVICDLNAPDLNTCINNFNSLSLTGNEEILIKYAYEY